VAWVPEHLGKLVPTGAAEDGGYNTSLLRMTLEACVAVRVGVAARVSRAEASGGHPDASASETRLHTSPCQWLEEDAKSGNLD